MAIPAKLKQMGLLDSEIRVYLYLLEQGVSTPPQIAQGTKIARPNCYKILRSLQEKKLIEQERKGKRRAYLASDPSALLQILERRMKTVKNLLPDLRALYTTQKNKPTIRFYDGFAQVKEIYEQTLSAEEVRGLTSTKKLFALDPKFFGRYRTKLRKKGIMFRDIITQESAEESGPLAKGELKGLLDIKVLPAKYKEMPTDILIWDDNVALMTLDPPIFGTILTNKALADTFRVIHDLIWENLEVSM